MYSDLISIIVPVYNVQLFLRECIDSLITQTYPNLEIILVDDGSTDASGEICDEYASKDERIIVVHKQNGGLSEARNIGIDKATGRYIGFVDSDDWISPDMYERLWKRITTGNHDIAVCGLIREYKNHSEIEKLVESRYNRDAAIPLLLEGMLLHDHAVSKLYRSELFRITRYPVGRYYEDVLTTYKTFLQANSIVVEPKALYHYRQRGGSLIKGGFTERRFELLRAVEALLEDRQLAQWSEYLHRRIIRTKYTLIYELAMYGDNTSISKHYPAIDTFFNDIKREKKLMKGMHVSKPLRMILSYSFLPNRLLFFMMRCRSYFNRKTAAY